MDKPHRKNILASCQPSHAEILSRLAEKNFQKIKLRRKQILNMNRGWKQGYRMKLIKESLNPPPAFGMHKKKESIEGLSNEKKAQLIASLLETLKTDSTILENMIEKEVTYEVCNDKKEQCAESIISLRKILQEESDKMFDDEEISIAQVFIKNKGVEILLPFLRFEYHEKILKETLCCLANLSMIAGQDRSNLKTIVPDLVSKIVDPSTLGKNLAQYLIIVEFILVCFVFILYDDDDTVHDVLTNIPNLGYISQLVRFKRESLSVITCMFINISISLDPIIIPDFLRSDLISDLIYGVKGNINIGREVILIFSVISNMKWKIEEADGDDGWIKIADECLQLIVEDKRVCNLLKDSMKLKHITTIKPLLDFIGNLVNNTECKLEEYLIKLPEFEEMINFCFESESFTLVGSLLWAISSMMNNPSVVDYFVTNINMLEKITFSYLSHKDLIVQKEACITLFYCMSQNKSNISIFNNEFSVRAILESLDCSPQILPETVMAVFSIIDISCEEVSDIITVFQDNGVIEKINIISEKFQTNSDIQKFCNELLDKYFETKENDKEIFGQMQNYDMQF
ncbi:unnamed protein product [Moneuplotes crassus]|uniref:Uncharacterized protein n=1 Tax=Euplotes crassus TaxID=5936 RepID=A0AAD1U846_EUPCR|nr:unnamed protein product [Moneuplotes crassus]